MRKASRPFVLLLVTLLFVSSPARAETAAVAGSIYPCMTELASLYEDAGQKPPELVMGSSGKLAAQIKAGAPFGLYLSASRKWALHLRDQGLLEDIHPMATSPIVLWWSRETPPSSKILRHDKTRVAMADPQAAPFGRAAQKYLAKQHLYNDLMDNKRLVIGGTVQQAALAARNGGADVAIVSLSIARKMDIGSETPLPIKPLSNAGALVKGNASAELEDFWTFIRSSQAAPVWIRWGFSPVTE